jgi:arylsulfatase A-like enzyme
MAALSVATVCGICFMIIAPRSKFSRPDAFSLFSSSSKQSSSSTKPNFVFILADDLGWNSIGYMGYDMSFVTPELDKLAASGIKLTNYYAMEYCNPSRAALLTGRYPLNMGMQYGTVEYDVPWGLRLEETLLPEVLKSEGYSTYMLGKWHLGHFNERYLPTARGFDTFTGKECYHYSILSIF